MKMKKMYKANECGQMVTFFQMILNKMEKFEYWSHDFNYIQCSVSVISSWLTGHVQQLIW